MEARVASEILASALRDMDEVIRASETNHSDSHFGGSYPTTINGLPNGTDHSDSGLDIGDSRNFLSYPVNSVPKSRLRPSSSEAHIQELLYELESSVECLKNASGLDLILPSKTRTFLRRFFQENNNHASTRDVSCNTMNTNHIDADYYSSSAKPSISLGSTNGHNVADDTLKSQIFLLQNQVNAQAQRIAELESKRERPLQSLLEKVSSLDQLDLLTEVSKQQVQIANLEQAKVALESQLQRLQERLADVTLTNDQSVNSIGQGNATDSLLRTRRNLLSPPATLCSMTGDPLNGALNDTLYPPPVPAHSRTSGYMNSPHSPLDLSMRPILERPRDTSTFNGCDFPSTQYQLPAGSIMDTYAFPQNGNMVNAGQYKSISLNELRQPRVDYYPNQHPTDHRSFLGQHGMPHFGTLPDSTVTNGTQLPPQYASDYHRQSFLTGRNRTPPAGKGEAGRAHLLSGRTITSRTSPHSDISLGVPIDGLPTPVPPSDKFMNTKIPTFPRARSSKQMQERFVCPVTPPASRRSTVRKQMSNLSDKNGTEYYRDGMAPSNHVLPRPKSTTRLRRLFSDNPFRWLSQRRNSTCETRFKSSALSTPPKTSDNNSPCFPSAAYAYGRSSSLRVPRNMVFHDVDPANNVWITKDSCGRPFNGAVTLRRTNGSFTPNDQSVIRQSVPNMPDPLIDRQQQPWDYAVDVDSVPSSSSTVDTKSEASQTHSLTAVPTGEPNYSKDSMPSCADTNSSPRGRRIFSFAYPSRDFVYWDKDVISAWMYELGLGYAVSSARRWLQQGADLVRASRKTIEQELGIRHSLHLKKLLLHLQLRTNESILQSSDPPFIRMKLPNDFNIAAWLEDLGLIEYAGIFENAAIDALVLNHLTLEDMMTLKINNELHVLSFRRGLQVLRRINFNLNCLCRDATFDSDHSWKEDERIKRSSNPDHVGQSDEGAIVPNGSNSVSLMSQSFTGSATFTNSPNTTHASSPALSKRSNTVTNLKNSDVCYWTQHRVKGWLNHIELPEFVPNLDGSGVTGALIILEDRFNPELLANILHIPSNKTLVRRHLTTKFMELVGSEVWEKKQQVANNSEIPILTPHSKIKLSRRRTFFIPQRRRKGLECEEELLCPLENDLWNANTPRPDNEVYEALPGANMNSQLACNDTELIALSARTTDII